MEASTSQLPSPSVQIREQPKTVSFIHTPEVSFCHPANGLPFLRLAAHDQASPGMPYGIHYGTAITACQILAGNKLGYLSISQDAGASGRIEADLDSIIFARKCFYHLQSEPFYPICQDFTSWTFPHKELPPTWAKEHMNKAEVWPSNWTALSEAIKGRDNVCLVSHWRDALTTAHIVGKIYREWLEKNDMDVYLPGESQLVNRPHNLFTLRWDLHACQFDQARFVIVPKRGQLVVHFLRPSWESVQLYHNVPFNHNNSVAHELLFARFAWALMKNVKDMELNPKSFKFIRTSEKTVPEQYDCDDGGQGDRSGGHRGGGGANSCPSEDDLEAQELKEDMKKAARTLPFFVDANEKADAWRYHDIAWYPGIGAVERRKRAYIDAHPEIRAHSDHVLPDDYDSDDNKDSMQ